MKTKHVSDETSIKVVIVIIIMMMIIIITIIIFIQDNPVKSTSHSKL